MQAFISLSGGWQGRVFFFPVTGRTWRVAIGGQSRSARLKRLRAACFPRFRSANPARER
jgi:hypothetical protein